MNAKLSQLNDEIRTAKLAISEAAMEGLRGDAMIQLKVHLRLLKEMYKEISK